MGTILDITFSLSLLAQAEGGGAEKPQQSPMTLFIMIGVMFLIMYFVMMRPQKKQEETRKKMLEALKKNDRVVTTGGIVGIITNIKEDEVVLRVDEDKKVKMRFVRSAIASVESDKVEGEKAS